MLLSGPQIEHWNSRARSIHETQPIKHHERTISRKHRMNLVLKALIRRKIVRAIRNMRVAWRSGSRWHNRSRDGFMFERRNLIAYVFVLASLLLFLQNGHAQNDPLPSWNDTSPKKAIIAFVERTTKEGSPDFVPVNERIATFDNDGTLWAEQPMYVQLAFIFDRVKELAPKHPEWKTTQPFKGVLEGDMKAVAATGEKGLMELMAATHAGMTVEEFEKIVTDWLATAQQPKFKRPYTQCVYQPMLELLAYLRANGFKTFIV